MQIQGSARIKLEDGSTVRLNYDAHNGQPYTPVGRILIERNIISREDNVDAADQGLHGAAIPTARRSCGGRTSPTCSSARCSCPTRTKRSAPRAFR